MNTTTVRLHVLLLVLQLLLLPQYYTATVVLYLIAGATIQLSFSSSNV